MIGKNMGKLVILAVALAVGLLTVRQADALCGRRCKSKQNRQAAADYCAAMARRGKTCKVKRGAAPPLARCFRGYHISKKFGKGNTGRNFFACVKGKHPAQGKAERNCQRYANNPDIKCQIFTAPIPGCRSIFGWKHAGPVHKAPGLDYVACKKRIRNPCGRRCKSKKNKQAATDYCAAMAKRRKRCKVKRGAAPPIARCFRGYHISKKFGRGNTGRNYFACVKGKHAAQLNAERVCKLYAKKKGMMCRVFTSPLPGCRAVAGWKRAGPVFKAPGSDFVPCRKRIKQVRRRLPRRPVPRKK